MSELTGVVINGFAILGLMIIIRKKDKLINKLLSQNEDMLKTIKKANNALEVCHDELLKYKFGR